MILVYSRELVIHLPFFESSIEAETVQYHVERGPEVSPCSLVLILVSFCFL